MQQNTAQAAANTAPKPPPTRKSQLQGLLGVGLGFFALLAIVFMCAVYVAPQVVSDWGVRGTAVPANNGHLRGKCSSKLFFNMCDVTLTGLTKDGTVTREEHLVFFSFSSNFTAQVLTDPAKPEMLTTDLALEHLWNRTIVLALILIGLGGATLAAGYAFFSILGNLVRGPRNSPVPD